MAFYKNETINKYMEKINAAISDKLFEEFIKVSISKGNIKIGRVMNVSTAAIVTCGNCSECKHYCYDIKAAMRFKNVLNSRARNTALLIKDRDSFFAQIDEACSRRKTNKYFRWHVSGEIQDIDYFERMVLIARNHPDFIFWTYTKRYDIVNYFIACGGIIPDNFKIMFSEWRGMPMDNPYMMPEFRVLMDGEKAPEDAFICPGNCDVCKAMNRGCIAGETVYNHIH